MQSGHDGPAASAGTRSDRAPRLAGRGGQNRLFASALAGAGLARRSPVDRQNKNCPRISVGGAVNAPRQTVRIEASSNPSPDLCVKAKKDFLQICLGDASADQTEKTEEISREQKGVVHSPNDDTTPCVHDARDNQVASKTASGLVSAPPPETTAFEQAKLPMPPGADPDAKQKVFARCPSDETTPCLDDARDKQRAPDIASDLGSDPLLETTTSEHIVLPLPVCGDSDSDHKRGLDEETKPSLHDDSDKQLEPPPETFTSEQVFSLVPVGGDADSEADNLEVEAKVVLLVSMGRDADFEACNLEREEEVSTPAITTANSEREQGVLLVSMCEDSGDFHSEAGSREEEEVVREDASNFGVDLDDMYNFDLVRFEGVSEITLDLVNVQPIETTTSELVVLPMLLGGNDESGACDLESEEKISMQTIVTPSSEQAVLPMFMGIDSDSEASCNLDKDGESSNENDSEDDLDDMYNFDPVNVAAAVQRGATIHEVQNTIEEELVGVLERRLAFVGELVIEPSEEGEQDRPCMTEDVIGMMTPECWTPRGGAQPALEAPHALDSSHVQAALNRTSLRRRRSSIERRALEEAVEAAQSWREQQGIQQNPDALEADEEANSDSHRVRRSSLSKTIEVLDCVEGSSRDIVDAETVGQAGMIQEAMLVARRRHRKSITKAVEQLSRTTTVQTTESQLNSSLSPEIPEEDAQDPLHARIQEAISMAYQRHREEAWAGHDLAANWAWQNSNNQDAHAQLNLEGCSGWCAYYSSNGNTEDAWQAVANIGSAYYSDSYTFGHCNTEDTWYSEASAANPSVSTYQSYGCGSDAMWQESNAWPTESCNTVSSKEGWQPASRNRTGMEVWRLGSA